MGFEAESAEEILAAATRMRAAANDIKWASINSKNAMEAHQQWMDRWLRRFKEIVDDLVIPPSKAEPAVPPRFEPGGMDDDIPF